MLKKSHSFSSHSHITISLNEGGAQRSGSAKKRERKEAGAQSGNAKKRVETVSKMCRKRDSILLKKKRIIEEKEKEKN